MANWRILVVDDDADIRNLISTTLQPRYETVEAVDGLDALEMIERAEPDFVILDVMMPLMDGLQTCEAIRRHPRFGDITVLFLSALAGNNDIRQGYSSGANLYLTKPFDPQRLLRNVDLFFDKMAGPPPARRFTVDDLRRFQANSIDAMAADTARHSALQNTADTQPRMPRISVNTPPPSARPRILAVDDDPQVCHLVKEALKHDYEVFTACDGLDAIDKITAYQPDIILIDTMMPKLSGYQLCTSLRRNARFCRTPIILASAKHSHKDREYSLRIGGNYFLQKPFTVLDVLEAVREMISHSDFKQYPKALTAAQIEAMEANRQANKKQDEQEAHHEDDLYEMQSFLKKHTDPHNS